MEKDKQNIGPGTTNKAWGKWLLSEWSTYKRNWNSRRSLQVYRAARMGSVLLVGIILAKSHWTTAQIGTFEWLLFIGSSLTFFWVNGLLQGLLPRYAEMNRPNAAGLLYTLFWVFTALTVTLVFLAWWGRGLIIPLLTGRESLEFFSIYLLFLLWHIPGFMLEYVYLLREEGKRMLWIALISYGSYVLAVLMALALNWGISGCLVLLGVWSFLRWLWTLYEVGKWKGMGMMYRAIPSFLRLSLPLVGYSFLNGMAQVVDGIIVGWQYADDASFAVFRYGAREIPLYSILIGSFSASIIPSVVNNPGWALNEMRRKGRQYMHFFFGLTILLLLLADPLYPLIYNADFTESASIFKCYLLLVMARVLFPYSWLMGKKQTDVLFRASVGELILNVGLSLWWVNIWGMEGIALATVVAYMLEKWGLIWWIKRKYEISVTEYADIKTYVFWSVITIVVFIISFWIY